jgi:hypothetical protein
LDAIQGARGCHRQAASLQSLIIALTAHRPNGRDLEHCGTSAKCEWRTCLARASARIPNATR